MWTDVCTAWVRGDDGGVGASRAGGFLTRASQNPPSATGCSHSPGSCSSRYRALTVLGYAEQQGYTGPPPM